MPDSLAEVKNKTSIKTMYKVEALAHALADLQPGVKAKTLADTLVDVKRFACGDLPSH